MTSKGKQKDTENLDELTPRQIDFLARYTNPTSPTFSNALQSALKAGYKQEYAENITHIMPKWLLDNVGKNKRLRKAEKIFDKTLEYNPVDEGGKVDTSLLAIQNKSAIFLTSTLGKNEGYTTRTEHTGKDGGKIELEVSREQEINEALDNL